MNITEQDKAILIEMWNNRVSVERISQLLPYKANTVRNIIQELLKDGILNRANRVKTLRDRITDMYLSGVTDMDELAEMFETSKNYVSNCLRDNKINHKRKTVYKKRKPNERIDERTQAIIDELKKGKSQTEIAKKFNVTRQWVFSIKKRFLKEQ